MPLTASRAAGPEEWRPSPQVGPPSADARARPSSRPRRAGCSRDTLPLALAVAKDMSLPPPPPPITLVLKVDLSGQRVTVVERGKVK